MARGRPASTLPPGWDKPAKNLQYRSTDPSPTRDFTDHTLTLHPLPDSVITACRETLARHDATDVAWMLGIEATA